MAKIVVCIFLTVVMMSCATTEQVTKASEGTSFKVDSDRKK